MHDDCCPTIDDNRLAFNHAGNEALRIDEYGGGMYISDSDPDIINNYICNNFADDRGGGLYIKDNSEPLIYGNIICNNEVGDNGAGFYITESIPFLLNNTISNNLANSGVGGSICVFDNSELSVHNTILWGNSPNYIQIDASVSVNLSYCDVEGGAPGEGNINQDPLFESPTSGCGYNYGAMYVDWSLNLNSPCINTGNNIYLENPPEFDLLGNNRIIPVDGTIDIGACEAFVPAIYVESFELPFGNIPMGVTESEYVYITNINETEPLEIINISIIEDNSSDFSMVRCPDLPFLIQPLESVDIMILYTAGPLNIESYAQLRIQSDDMCLPDIYINLSGEAKLSSSSNWISFPKLDVNAAGEQWAEDVLEELEPYPIAISTEGEYMIYYPETGWNHDGGLEYLNRASGYHLFMLSDFDTYDFTPQGNLVNPDITFSLSDDIYGGNLIGYWLMQSQNMNEAFGEHWDKVLSIQSEFWTYIYDPVPEGGQYPGMKMHPLHYGHSYIVEVSEDIPEFTWHNPVEVPIVMEEINLQPEYFVYEQTIEYQVIDVIDIDESITEIGVYENEICIGAVVVDESSEQILVYPDSLNQRENGNITFEVIYNGRNPSITINNYSVYDRSKGLFIKKKIISNENFYSLVSFGNEGIAPIPDKVTLKQNYPNPFNPNTKITYSIPSESNVELTIYNLKGQVVKSLVKEEQIPGHYEVTWNGRDSNKKAVASGIYFYQLNCGKSSISKKMILLK